MKKFLLISAVLLLATPADACTRWWAGGGSSTNWNATSNTNWSSVGSGTPNNASVPTTTDDVCFDATSPSPSNISAAITISTLVMTGYTGTLSHATASQLTINGGTITFAAGMTYTPTGTASMSIANASTATNLTTAGVARIPPIVMTTVGSNLVLQDDLTINTLGPGGWSIDHQNGILNANNHNLTLQNFQSNTAVARTLTMGTGTWKLAAGGTGAIWNMASTTNLTMTANTATIEVLAEGITPSTGRSIALSNISNWPSISIDAATGLIPPVKITCAAGCTLPALTVTAPNMVQFTNGQITVFTAMPTFLATAASTPIMLGTSSPGALATVSVASGTMQCSYCAIRDITFQGGATFNAGKSFNLGNNVGVTITPPAGSMLGG